MKTKWAIVAGIVLILVMGSYFVYVTYGSGTLVVKMTDPPSWGAASQVYIYHSDIKIHRAEAANESGWSTIVQNSAWVNLTRLLDVNETIRETSLQAGLYNLIRFNILDAKVTVGGVNYTCSVPSSEITIAITQGGIRVNAGQTSTLLIDVNSKVQGSVASGFKLVPAVRATPT